MGELCETAIRKDEMVYYIAVGMNNSVVTVPSTDVGALDGTMIDRYIKKKRAQVYHPKAIEVYNSSMVGTDQIDLNIACYSWQQMMEAHFYAAGTK